MKLILSFFLCFISDFSFAEFKKDLTVMVYISARNNLALEALNDINEMETVGSDDRVNFVAELGRIKGENVFNPFENPPPLPPQNDWTGSRRIFIKKDLDKEKVNSEVLSYEENADMGNWTRLMDFIKWSKKNFPAKKYILIVGGHGSGWRGVKEPSNKGIAYDDLSKNHISPEEFAKALKESGGADIVVFDACLMQTVEFLYELKGVAKYVVASQESTPGEGYDYSVTFSKIASSSNNDNDLINSIIKSYVYTHFEQKQRSITVSAVNIQTIEELSDKINRLAIEVLGKDSDIKLYNDKRFSLRSFEDEDARDLYQLALMYYENSKNDKTRTAAKNLMVFLAEKFVILNAAKGYKSKDAYGVSIHFPFYYLNYNKKYEFLSFAKDTYWDEMIKASIFSNK